MFPLDDGQLQFVIWAMMFDWFILVLYLYWTGGDNKYLLKWQAQKRRAGELRWYEAGPRRQVAR